MRLFTRKLVLLLALLAGGLCCISDAGAALLSVLGGPTPPIGKTLAGTTGLRVHYSAVYSDGTATYPTDYQADWDTSNARWKPHGSIDGTAWMIPGADTSLNDPLPPTASFSETQVYSDGKSQTFAWQRRVIGNAGTWDYRNPDPSTATIKTLFSQPTNSSWINIKGYPASGVGNGTANDYNAYSVAMSVAPAGGMINTPPGTYRISQALSFANKYSLFFDPSSKWSVDSGVTVTLNAPIAGAPLSQIFSGSGSVLVGSSNPQSVWQARWWGATGDGSTDDTAAVQRAITALGATTSTLVFSAGTYRLAGSLTVPANITVRGEAGARTAIETGITIQGPVDLGTNYFFSGAGPVAFTGNVKLDRVMPEWWGAKADTKRYQGNGSSLGFSTTAGSPLVTPVGFAFSAADVGKVITVQGAGAAGAVLSSTVSSYNAGTGKVTLSANAATTVTAKTGDFGHDDTAAIQAAVLSLDAAGGKVDFSPGTWRTTSPILVNNVNCRLIGSGRNTTQLIGPVGGKVITPGGSFVTGGSAEFKLQNMTLLGHDTTGDGVIDTTGATISEARLMFEGLTCSHFGDYAIKVAASTQFTNVSRCYFSFNKYSLSFGLNSDVVVEDCQFSFPQSGEQVTVVGPTAKIVNSIFGRGTDGEGATGTAPDILIPGGVGSGYITITGNKFGPEGDSTSRFKIRAYSANGLTISNVKIFGNDFLGAPGQTAISVENPIYGWTVNNNVFDRFGTVINDVQPVVADTTGLSMLVDNITSYPNSLASASTLLFTNGGRGFTTIRSQNQSGQRDANGIPLERETPELANFIRYSEDPTNGTYWLPSIGVTLTLGQLDPLGTGRAFKLTRNGAAGSQSLQAAIVTSAMKAAGGESASGTNGRLTVKFWAKAGSLTTLMPSIVDVSVGTILSSETITLSPGWRQYKMVFNGLVSAHAFNLAFYPGSTAAESGDLYIAFPQVSNYDCDYVPTTSTIYGPDLTIGQYLTKGLTVSGATVAKSTLDVTGAATVGGTLTIGGGAAVRKVLSGTGILNFPSTASGASSDLTITVTGAVLGDVVTLGIPNASVPSGAVAFTAWVSAADTVTVRFANFSGGALDPASGTFRANVIQM